MRAKFGFTVETGRLKRGRLASAEGDRNGAFVLQRNNYCVHIIVSDGSNWKMNLPGEPFEHVSVRAHTHANCEIGGGTPPWSIMQWVKTLFFEDSETVMQVHPPEKDYVNTHPDVLHLWRPTVTPILLPPREAV